MADYVYCCQYNDVRLTVSLFLFAEMAIGNHLTLLDIANEYIRLGGKVRSILFLL